MNTGASGNLRGVFVLLVFAIAAGINILWSTQRGRVQQRMDAFSPRQQTNAQRIMYGAGVACPPLLNHWIRNHDHR